MQHVLTHSFPTRRSSDLGGSSSNDDKKPIGNTIGTVTGKSGDVLVFDIPEGVDVNIVVATFTQDGKTVIVPTCNVEGNKIKFIAPVDATYNIVSCVVSFNDISKHWAKNYIEMIAARGLMRGVANNDFAPDSPLTRAMITTILHRLAYESKYTKASKFTDMDLNT